MKNLTHTTLSFGNPALQCTACAKHSKQRCKNPAVTGFTVCRTGCTFVGVARALKAANPSTLCAVVEPTGCRPLAGEKVSKPRHLIQGTSYGAAPPQWDPGLMDLGIAVTDEDAELWRRRIAKEEGLYVGYSAAANVCAAAMLLNSGRLGPDAVVATLLCDTGLKY